MKNSTPLPFGSTKFLNSQTGLRCRVGPAYKHSVSQLFHGPAPRSPLHRLAVRLRHSRSNTSTEYSLPGATQLSQVRVNLSQRTGCSLPLFVHSWDACMHASCMHVSFTRPPAHRARHRGVAPAALKYVVRSGRQPMSNLLSSASARTHLINMKNSRPRPALASRRQGQHRHRVSKTPGAAIGARGGGAGHTPGRLQNRSVGLQLHKR